MKHLYKITFFLLLAFFPTTASAYDFEVDGIYYNINGTNATVTYQNEPFNYSDYSGKVIIPSTVFFNGTTYSVTEIGNSAFYCTNLISITIPESVTSIGDYAFCSCYSLTSVVIPKSVTSFGTYVFENCYGLTSVVMSESVTSISNFAFSGCTSLASITIPESVTNISDAAFYNCSSLTSITIPSSVTNIGEWAFDGCSSLTSITIPEGVTSIGYSAFGDCPGLTLITIPSSVTSIGEWAFYGCSRLTSITIPEGVTSIGRCAFSNCSSLTSISVNSNNAVYDSRDNCNAIIKKSNNELIAGCKNTIIPSSVTSIGNYAFLECTALTLITIPQTIISIGSNAFANCTGLTSITIPESVTSIGTYAFANCTGLNLIMIPSSGTSIGTNVFHNCIHLSIVFITGNNEWQAGALPGSVKTLYIGSEVTGVKGMQTNPKKIYSYAATPPVCDENSFTSYDAELHVPASSMAAYFTTPYWCNFTSIIGDAVAVTDLSINRDSIELIRGEQITLHATVSPTGAMPNDLTWQTSDKSVATIENGVVTALNVGECDIIVTCQDKRAICHVIVIEPFIHITLDEHEARLLPNHLMILTPTVTPVATDLVVTSSNPAVAAARMAGNKIQVMGITEGTTTIYVNSADGYAFSDSCLVEVYTELGDVNCDGFVNISDVTHLIDYLLSGDVPNFKPFNADVSGDGNVTIKDVTGLIDMLLSGDSRLKKSECPGNPMPIQSIRLIRGLPMPSSPIEPYRGGERR